MVSVAYGYLGGWRKISRVLSDLGNDARGRDASIGTRSRTSDSSSMRDHDLDTGRTPARGRSCQPRGRSVASVPVGCWKWDKRWDKTKTATPAAVPAQKVVRRGRAGNARLHRPHGPCTRPKDPVDKIRRRAREIRDRTRWTRANIDVACRARLPGFQGKNRGECDRRVGRRTGVNLRASSPVWPVGSSTFARVLACRLKGVSRRVDWRAAVNRVLEARKEVAFELGGGDVESKTKIPRELDRVASGVQSTVVFLCLQKPKTEIHRTVLSQSIIRPIT